MSDQLKKDVQTKIDDPTVNPMVKLLQPKQKLLCRKAKIKRVITGWLPCDSANIARRYNVGDPDYSAKLDYVMTLLQKIKR